MGDLERSVAFYRDVVNLPVALEAPSRAAAFFWVGGPGQAMLGLWSLGSAPLGMVLHVAFGTGVDEVLEAVADFIYELRRRWMMALRGRSQKTRMSWTRFSRLAADWLPNVRNMHPYPEQRFAAMHPR